MNDEYTTKLNDILHVRKIYLEFVRDYSDMIHNEQNLTENFNILKYPVLLKMNETNKKYFKVSEIIKVLKETHILIAQQDVVAGFRFLDIVTGYCRIVKF